MPKINVAKAFRLKLAPQADFIAIPAGEQDVSDEVASHWYTQEHLVLADPQDEAADEAPAEPVAEAEADLNADEAVDPLAEEPDPDASLDDTTVREDDPPVEADEDAPAEEVAAEDDATMVDAMNDDELRAFITKRDGKAPHHMLGHDKLLALAKG